MSEFLGSIWWMLVTLGVLITFHEYGHFVVARRFGVKVLRFSVGFGNALWSRYGRDGTEYRIAAVPLGGYVKMLDEREGEVRDDELDQAFNRKPVGARIAIVIAGPLFNLIFAVFAFWLMFVVGKPDYLPILGQPTGLAQEAGIQTGDRIVRLDGEPLASWSAVQLELIDAIAARRDVALEVQGTEGGVRRIGLPLSHIARDLDEVGAIKALGIAPKDLVPPPVIGDVSWRTPADQAGLQAGDRVLSINGTEIESFQGMAKVVQAEAAGGKPLNLVVQRDHSEFPITLTPEKSDDKDAAGNPIYRMGVGPVDMHDTVLRYGPVDAVPAALRETWNVGSKTVSLLKHLIFGRVSASNLQGPVGIAQFANYSAHQGFATFISFLGLLSLSLCLMNLLPIPILDGGHLLYYLIELVKRSPLSERAMVMGQYVGLAFLMGLMGLAFYNDILRLVSL
jgi:regulator of sigma E protease